MECQASESKKLFKVFDASERKRSRKRREGEVRSAASDGSTSGGRALVQAKSSLQDMPHSKTEAAKHNVRNIDSSPSVSRSQTSVNKVPSSPRRHRRPKRNGTSLALKASFAPSPRSMSPPQEGDATFEALAQDKNSLIYTFLEEAIKRGKKKHRHSRRHEERGASRVRASSPSEHHDQPELCDQPVLREERNSRDRLRDTKEQRESREHRDSRVQRDSRDHRDSRDYRDSRDQRVSREQHDQEDQRLQRDHRDHRGRDYSDQRDHSDQQAERDVSDQRDKCDQRDNRDHREQRRNCVQRTHRRDDDNSSRESDKVSKVVNPEPVIDQKALIETFAKLCATITTKTDLMASNLQRTLSHKSLQCEVVARQTCANEVDHRPVKLNSQENSQDKVPASRIRSQEDNRERIPSRENIGMPLTQTRGRSTYCVPYDKEETPRERYSGRLDNTGSKMHNATDDRCREYDFRPAPTISCIDQRYKRSINDTRGYREHNFNREPTRDCDHRREVNRQYDQERVVNRNYDPVRDINREKYYGNENRRYFDQKTSRSFDVPREVYVEDDRPHMTARSDVQKERRYDERRYDDRIRERLYEEMEKRDKYYEDKPLVCRERKSHMSRDSRERRNKNYTERLERASIGSRDDEYKEKDRLSERERDSGLSVADGESIASARSNNLKLIKQEIAEQRENMDAMMNLWKDLMRCFKSSSQASGSERAATESAANNAREGAATQLRLWRECMRRYETVARDVGDTDARLMEEINKQRSEMAEMAGMWQECLRRYREMSSDFNNLKQKLAAPASPVRPLVQPVYAEGEGPALPEVFQQPVYPPMPGLGYGGGSPVRARASAPPAWWWGEAPAMGHNPRVRRLSPDSPDSRDRERDRDREREREHRRHKDRERDDSRYKEKSKPSNARSEHRRRKR